MLYDVAVIVLTTYCGTSAPSQVIKPNPAAPPAGKLPAYVLYILSFLTFFGCTFFFLIYPCCCGARKPKDAPFTGGPGGMMVLPVGGFPGQKPKKKGKKGRKGKKPKKPRPVPADPCSHWFPGHRPFEAPEVNNIANYITQLPNLHVFLDLRSYGQMCECLSLPFSLFSYFPR